LAHGANPFGAYSGGHAVFGLCGGCSRNVREAVQSQPLLQSASVDSCWEPFDTRDFGWAFGAVDGVRAGEDKSSRQHMSVTIASATQTRGEKEPVLPPQVQVR